MPVKQHPNPDKCIACTTCVVHCPVAQVTTKFLGPRMIGPAYERFRLLGLGEEESLHYCSNCKNCDIACPHDVPVSTFNMLARAEYSRKHRPPLRDWVLGHGERMAKLLGFIPAALKNVGMLNPATRIFLDALGISSKAPLPAFAPQTFRTLHKKTYQGKHERRVVFFPGCFIDIYDPRTGQDMVWALNKAGYEVIVPDAFVCCGLPMIANGFWEDARANAARNMQELHRWQQEGVPVLTGCPSCALMFKSDLPEYFPEVVQPGQTPTLADAQAFLLDCIERGELLVRDTPSTPENMPHRIIYHAPCHLRAQGIGLPGLELLKNLPGMTVENADAGCCGISGSYGFKKEKYPIAMQVGSTLFDAVRHSEAPVAASECGTCRVQIKHGSGKDCLHPVSFLRRALEGRTARQ